MSSKSVKRRLARILLLLFSILYIFDLSLTLILPTLENDMYGVVELNPVSRGLLDYSATVYAGIRFVVLWIIYALYFVVCRHFSRLCWLLVFGLLILCIEYFIGVVNNAWLVIKLKSWMP